MTNITILTDETAANPLLVEMLERLGHRAIELSAVEELIENVSRNQTEIVLIDKKNDSPSAVAALSAIIDSGLSLPIIIVARTARSEDVIESMKLGAFDFLSGTLSLQELEQIIQKAKSAPMRSSVLNAEENGFFIGQSLPMKRIEKQIGVAAACNSTVLIRGETGTGKDSVARAIHRHSRQRDQSLTIIDCTAVPEDYESFESLGPDAAGTVILDEIGDLNATTQAMLVRALKEITDSPRIIATTQYDLLLMVKEKRFREDLFYRLNVFSMVLPPLRERGSDILALAEIFLRHARPDSPKLIRSSAAKVLLDHNWPGNVRELENLMYHLTLAERSNTIEASDLGMLPGVEAARAVGDDPLATMDYYAAMAALEKQLLERALQQANGSRAEAARILGINRQLLYSKLKAHGLMK